MSSKGKNIKMKVVRSRMTQPDPAEGAEVVIGESLTSQEFKEEVDINNITSRYLNTGLLPVMTGQPLWGEIPSETYQDMVNTINDTKQDFLSLPSKIRNRFDNDPLQLIRFVENPDNRAEALKLGLIEEEPVRVPPEPPKAPETPPMGGLPQGDK